MACHDRTSDDDDSVFAGVRRLIKHANNDNMWHVQETPRMTSNRRAWERLGGTAMILCCFAFGTRSFRVPARRAAPFSKPSRCCLAPVLLLRLTT